MKKESILRSFLRCVISCSNSEFELNQLIEVAFNVEQKIKK
ncbi:hypothetical protein P9C71_gp32 [Bacillus phage F16Ba]|uniref:Uncharacterized protein n=1 Tax=Bacillus phage F16Ba TaxID=2767194 RepID=A0A7U0M723_9CAUD|nr:hypothetical protein P9C71_gp32 [Bacillus phage F16Ba]QQX27615.1 hypothetical protein F16Ba_032 [Bacillus phage F16Ba]